MPSTLPATVVPTAMLNMHYSLPTAQRQLQPLRRQLSDMEAWCTATFQLDRAGGSIKSSTWENIISDIYLYLGFQHRYMQVPAPTLESFADTHMYSHFMAYQVAKGKTINSHTQTISHCKKVLIYLGRARSPGTALSTSPTDPASLAQVHEWLNRLRQQLIHHVPRKRKDIGDMLESGKWVAADELVRIIHDYASSTVARIPLDGPCDFPLARTLHDACLTSCMFSHLPPVRLICLRTLQLPTAIGCLTSDCSRAGCQGNRLVLRPDGSMHMLFSHYKVDKK